MNDDIKEVWADIDDYPGYQISSHGRVRSVDRNIASRNSMKPFPLFRKGKMLKMKRTVNGRAYVLLFINGTPNKLIVSELVEKHFNTTEVE